VAGDFSIFEDTRSYLLSKIVSNDSFFSHFTKPIITFDTPLGIFKQLQVEKGLHSGRLDIKTGGIFPIVHGVRALALENGLLIGSSNTFDRIDALVEKDIIEKAFAKNLKEAFQFLLNLKLTALLGKSMSGESVDRFVQTHTLSKLERDLLKESLHIVREFKSILVYHFKLSLFSP
ncbi:MAG: cyclic nucleotide-binding/CBS domain-containing protein, partial [Alphaproteobacteria bacterium]|nr:cyclic nucleotide-binding/CBS domain-containing protein [Alphaproteobacteria bacterium]